MRLAGRRRGRHRPALGARALRRDARLLRRPARPSRTRRRRASSASPRSRPSSPRRASARPAATRHDALGGPRRRRALAPEVSGLPPRPTTPSSCPTTAARASSTRAGLQAAGLLSADELAEIEAGLAAIARPPDVLPEDEDVHSAIERAARRGRAQDPRRPVAQRPGRGGVAAVRRRRLRRGDARRSTRSPARSSRARRPRRRDADARLHAPAAGAAGHRRPPPARLGGDARARPRPLRASRREQAAPSPLGAGALAGSTPRRSRRRPAAMRNSLDAVADRDFALDYLYACAVLFGHLSRIGEELVPLGVSASSASRGCRQDAATGSSMMPQKLNPDVAELVRGKAGTALGRLAGLLAIGQGPAARLRPRPAGGQDAGVRGAARRRAAPSPRSRVARRRARVRPRAAGGGRAPTRCSSATDAAEALVREGVPFRDAHERVAEQVRDGSFTGIEPRPRPAPGPGGVRAALAEAKMRFGADDLS